MENYLAYWKRGWWAWLLMLCTNIGFVVLVLPLAFIFGGNKNAYWISALVVWLVIGAPFLGWLFEQFANHSSRLSIPQNENRPVA